MFHILLAAMQLTVLIAKFLKKTNDVYSASYVFGHNIFMVITSRIQTTL